MQSVSNEWIAANTKNILPLSDVKISYYIEDKNVTQYYNYTSNSGGGSWVATDYASLYDRNANYEKFIVLDYGSFILDGTYVPYESTMPQGLVLKGPNATAITIEIHFSQVITTTLETLTLKWGEAKGIGQYDTYIRVRNNNTTISSFTYNIPDGEMISIIPINLSNFDEITFTISMPKKNTCAYVEQVIFGGLMEFTKKDIIKVVQKDIIDPNNLALPTFELDNRDGRFNPDNPTGIYSYLQEGQEILLKYGLWIDNAFEYIIGGTYFLTKWNVPNNGITATFEVGSKLDFMNDIFVAGLPTSRPHSQTLALAINRSGIDSSWFSVDNSLLTNSGYEILYDNNAKLNEIIQYICNAERIRLYIDRLGVIHIDEMFDGDISSLTQENYTIDKNISYKAGEYELIRPLKNVTMTYATSTSNTDVKETTNVNADGVAQTLNNLLISTSANAISVNNQVENILTNRKRISGSFRPDIRLDIWDRIYITNKYATNLSVLITELEITYNGAFSGTYKGIIKE